jgi:hypothetical protein
MDFLGYREKDMFQGKKLVYSAPKGINVTVIYDRSVGLARIEDDIKWRYKIFKARFDSFIKVLIPRIGSITGTYKKINGQWIRTSRHTSGIDIWISKHGMFPDQGRRELHNHYVSLDQRGELKDVDDRSVWEPLRQRYGRHKVPIM